MVPGQSRQTHRRCLMAREEQGPTFERLQDQIAWYDTRSGSNQKWFKGLKAIEIVCAAFIPFTAGFEVSPWIIGSLGVSVVITEGWQQLNQFHGNWISYRSTAEYLKHEK